MVYCCLSLIFSHHPAGGPAMAAASKAAFAAAIARLEAVGGQRVEVDFAPFAEAAALLYQSSFVAERYSGIRTFLDKPSGGPAQQPEGALQQQRSLNDDQRLLPVTRAIISGSGGWVCWAIK
jgi:allophanate hydrolase